MASDTKTISITDKKIDRWGTGWTVFITTEAKKLGWKHTDKVRISAEEGNRSRIIIERV